MERHRREGSNGMKVLVEREKNKKEEGGKKSSMGRTDCV